MAYTETTTIEGTPEQLAAWLEHLPDGKRYRITEVKEPKPETAQKPASTRVSAMGKYAGILSSEEFMRRKQKEIDLENRPCR